MRLRRPLVLAFVTLAALIHGPVAHAQSLQPTVVRGDSTARESRPGPHANAPYAWLNATAPQQIAPSHGLFLLHGDTSVKRADSTAHTSRAKHVVYGLLIGAAAGWGAGLVLDHSLNRNSARACGGCDHVYYTTEILTAPLGALVGGIVGVLLPTR